MKDKICFVVQRYGMEVNGGAELQCRLFAEHLIGRYDIEVLTTRAIDYITWKNEYTEGIEQINGVTVRRFSVDRPRQTKSFNAINSRFLTRGLNAEEEQKWVDEQGPYCPMLVDYLKFHKDEYKAFVFFGYLYYTSVMGLPVVKDRAVFIPEAHDEPFMRMEIYKRLFYMPGAFFFNTEEERDLIHRKFNNEDIPCDIGGIGIDKPGDVDADAFKEKYGLDNYIIYVGRIDEGKNCHVLFKYFGEYKKRNDNDLKLVLVGRPVIDIPKDDSIVSLGFLDEQDKINGVAGAKMMVLPSEFESLSMVVLEAMSLDVPVIVNGRCNVLKGHCIKSNGAFYYNNYFEFEAEINYLLEHTEEADIMTRNAEKYVDENYRWEAVTERLSRMIEAVQTKNETP